MGWRYYSNDPEWRNCCSRWVTPDIGRYYKRQLSKARRRRAKLEAEGDYRGPIAGDYGLKASVIINDGSNNF